MRRHDIPEDITDRLGITSITDITDDPKESPAPGVFPIGAMPEGCRRLIEEAAAAIGCPPEFVGLPMLSVLAAAIGNSRVLKLKGGWEEGAAIYGAIIAEPGEKKTPALKVALEPAKRAQAALKKKYQRAEDEYKREQREYEVDKKDAAKAGEPAPPPPQEPTMERTLVDDTTVERLAGLQAENPRGVVVIRDELSGWARAMDQYKQGGRGADRQFWLSAWSNSYVSVDRKSQPHPLIVSRPFVALFGAIQPSVLPELGDGREDGLLDRFLFAYPEAEISGWSDAEISEDVKSSYASLYTKLLSLSMPTDEYGDPEPVRIHFAPDAKEVLKETINELRREMYAPGFPARLKGPWSKLEGYFARLTLILATARAADEDTAERVKARDVLAAVVLLDYFKNHARRVYVGLHGDDPDDRLAADIAEFLKERGGAWEGQPAELHAQLESDYKPERANELTKRLKAIAAKTPGLDFEAGERWDKELHNKRRFVRVSLRNVGNVGNVGNGGASGKDTQSDAGERWQAEQPPEEGIAEDYESEENLDDLFGAEPKVVSIESGEPYDVYVGRGKRGTKLEKSKWHNPYVVGEDGDREECIESFRRYLLESPELTAALPEIRGKILGCHCAPEGGLTKDDPLYCHGQVLLRFATSAEDGLLDDEEEL